jgi:hypothetical protein
MGASKRSREKKAASKKSREKKAAGSRGVESKAFHARGAKFKAAAVPVRTFSADEFLRMSVAPDTMRCYKREWVKWLQFARCQGMRLAPPRAKDLLLYLVREVAPRWSVTVLEAVSASVDWHYAESNEPSTFSERRIGLLVRGMRAEFRNPSQSRIKQ